MPTLAARPATSSPGALPRLSLSPRPQASSHPAVFAPRILVCFGLGLALTLAHFYLIFAAATPADRDLRGRYDSLVGHDSYWFWRIIDHGYQTIIPPAPRKNMELSNVAFFPGYPLLAAGLIRGLGMDPKAGLLTATHLSTWAFWTYLLLMLRDLRLSARTAGAAVGFIFVHPGALFLIVAYSESLFLTMLLGFLFWQKRPGLGAGALAALHGFYATATRVAGFPAAVWPFVERAIDRFLQPRQQGLALSHGSTRASALFRPQQEAAPQRNVPQFASASARTPFCWESPFPTFRIWWRPLLLSGLAMSGTLAFFYYCHVRFGFWDLYMWTQESGWGVKPDYLALLKIATYEQLWPDWTLPWSLGRFLVTATSLCFIILVIAEVRAARRRSTSWRTRFPLYFVGAVLFFIAVSGVYSVRLESMLRYQFCTHVFLVLALAHACRDFGFSTPCAHQVIGVGLALLAAFSLYIQLHYAQIFTYGGWVA